MNKAIRVYLNNWTHHRLEDHIPMVTKKVERIQGTFGYKVEIDEEARIIIVRTDASATNIKKIIASLRRGDKPNTRSWFILDAEEVIV